MSTTKLVSGDYTIQSLNGNVNIIGNLNVAGSTSSVSSTDTKVQDNIITLNDGETGSGVTKGTAGIEVDRGVLDNVSIIWEESSSSWKFTNDGFTFYALGSGGGGGGATTGNITAASTTNPVRITTDAPVGLTDGQLVTITDVDGMTELNGNSYYVDTITSVTFDLYSDEGLSIPVNGTLYGSGTTTGLISGSGGLTRVSQDIAPALGGNLNILSRSIYSSTQNVALSAGAVGSGGTGLYVDNSLNTNKELATVSKSVVYGIIFS